MIKIVNSNLDRHVKNRHTREGGYPHVDTTTFKNGFPIKDFGNDGSQNNFFANSTIIVYFFIDIFSHISQCGTFILKSFKIIMFETRS